MNLEDSQNFQSMGKVLNELKAILKKPHTVDHITFSGNGEPTLHPDFPTILHETIKLRDQYKPGAKVAVLTNGSRVNRPEVVSALNQADKAILKLDAGDQVMFQLVNDPLPGICLSDLIQTFQSVKNCIIQALFFGGKKGNANLANILNWIELVRLVKPVEVQIYTVDRGAPDSSVLPLSRDELERVSLLYSEKTHFSAQVY